jgi:hypothetical protein
MDCCSTKKTDNKEDNKNLTPAEPEAAQNDHQSRGGCCGGGSMWQHILIMLVIFGIIWFFGRS